MTIKKGKFLLTVAVMITLLAIGGNLYAVPELIISPERQATAGTIYSDTDFFMLPGLYNLIDFDRFFATVNFQSDFANFGNTYMAQLGVAARFGSIFTGLYYGGNGLPIPAKNYTIEDGKKNYNTLPELYLGNNPNERPYNEFAFLLGLYNLNMGFRFSFVLDEYRTEKHSDFLLGGADYKSYKAAQGSLRPGIAWGYTDEFIKGSKVHGISPHAYLNFDIYNDYVKEDQDGNGDIIDGDVTRNHFGFDLLAVTGALTFYEKNDISLAVDLWWTYDMRFFSNEYYLAPGESNKFKGKYNAIDGVFETGFIDSTLTPYLYFGWEGKRIELAAELGFIFGFNRAKTAEYDISGSEAVLEGTSADTFTFSFTPNLALGMKLALVRGKGEDKRGILFLNAGANIEFFTVELANTKEDNYIAGNIDGDTIKYVDNNFNTAITELYLGFTLNPTNNFSVQAVAGVVLNSNNVSLFDTVEGLGVFSKLLATVKF